MTAHVIILVAGAVIPLLALARWRHRIDSPSGVVVPVGEVPEAAKALRRLVTDPGMRRRLGRAGRTRVEQRFAWDPCLRTMCEAYRRTLRRAA